MVTAQARPKHSCDRVSNSKPRYSTRKLIARNHDKHAQQGRTSPKREDFATPEHAPVCGDVGLAINQGGPITDTLAAKHFNQCVPSLSLTTMPCQRHRACRFARSMRLVKHGQTAATTNKVAQGQHSRSNCGAAARCTPKSTMAMKHAIDQQAQFQAKRLDQAMFSIISLIPLFDHWQLGLGHMLDQQADHRGVHHIGERLGVQAHAQSTAKANTRQHQVLTGIDVLTSVACTSSLATSDPGTHA